MLTVNECVSLLRENDGFCLLTHVRPDGDTLCSAAALCSALRRMGKRAALYRNPDITETYAPLMAPYLWTEGERGFVVACDVADVTMVPESWHGDIDLAIDHHPKNPGYAKQTLLNGDKASCGELVMEVIETLCGDLTKAHGGELSYLLQDCSAATENLLLAAHALSLGGCWLGVHPRADRVDGIRRLFGLPEKIVPVAAVAVGWPAEEFKARTRFRNDAVTER